MVHIDQQVYPPYRIGLTRQKVGRNRKRPRLTLHLDFPKGEHMDTPKHFKHAPCTLKFPHISAFWTFVKLAQISTFSPIERFRIALQCVQPRALQAPINTRPPRKFAPQNTSTAQGVLVLRVVLTACTTMNVCSPKVLATACASLLLNSRCCPTFMAAAVHSVGVVQCGAMYAAVVLRGASEVGTIHPHLRRRFLFSVESRDMLHDGLPVL
jgi:hypothetical protein